MGDKKERFAQEYDNTNRGALFTAKEKRKETSPDYTGEVTIHCPGCTVVSEFWLSGWKKKARNSGATFLSLAVNPKTPDTDGNGNKGVDTDEDIPF